MPDERPYAELARAGIGLLAVDDLTSGFDEEGNPTGPVVEVHARRNEAMAHGMADAVRAGRCRKVVGIFGRGHVLRHNVGDPILNASAPERLAARGFRCR